MKTLLSFLIFLIGIYLLICLLLYFFQEKMIYFPQRLSKDFTFEFKENFEEQFVEMEDGVLLHSLLFTAENSKGVIFYLHGNAGSLMDWGGVAEIFTLLDYDVFIPDYRGYGKSDGAIKNEAQMHGDMSKLYQHLVQVYPEKEIVILGHSIGSGMAAKLAAANNPKLLILQAPFYSIPHLAGNTFPLNLFPGFLIKYKFETGKYVQETNVPVVVLHGDKDEIINYGSSLKLQENFKPGDTLITLEGYGHNNFIGTQKYNSEIKKILEKY